MKLETVKHLKVGDILEFVPIMKMSLKEAIPEIIDYKVRHKLNDEQIKIIGNVIVKLGLYPVREK